MIFRVLTLDLHCVWFEKLNTNFSLLVLAGSREMVKNIVKDLLKDLNEQKKLAKKLADTEFVRQYLRLVDEGFDSREALAAIKRMGYKKCRATFFVHLQAFKSTGSAHTDKVQPGRTPKLSADVMDELKDWLTAQNASNEPICRRDVQKFLDDGFGIIVTVQTVSNLLRRLGFRFKSAMNKTAGFKKPNSELKVELMGFIREMKASNKFVVSPSKIRSLDVTVSRRPNGRVMTYGPAGVKQKSKKKVKRYSDSIYDMVSADGLNHTPCILVTHNPIFAPLGIGGRAPTARRLAIRADLEAALAKCNIAESRIVYKKSTKTYCFECADDYEAFLQRHLDTGALTLDCLVLHDGGNAYKRGPVSIFDSMEFEDHVTYPSDVHQYLSPNDNKLHGCKTIWAQEYYKLNDHEVPLRLMQLLDEETVKHSKQYFQNNLLKVTPRMMDEMLVE